MGIQISRVVNVLVESPSHKIHKHTQQINYTIAFLVKQEATTISIHTFRVTTIPGLARQKKRRCSPAEEGYR